MSAWMTVVSRYPRYLAAILVAFAAAVVAALVVGVPLLWMGLLDESGPGRTIAVCAALGFSVGFSGVFSGTRCLFRNDRVLGTI